MLPTPSMTQFKECLNVNRADVGRMFVNWERECKEFNKFVTAECSSSMKLKVTSDQPVEALRIIRAYVEHSKG